MSYIHVRSWDPLYSSLIISAARPNGTLKKCLKLLEFPKSNTKRPPGTRVLANSEIARAGSQYASTSPIHNTASRERFGNGSRSTLAQTPYFRPDIGG